MTKSEIKKSMRRLPVADRIELLDDLQISIAKDEADIPLYDWQKKILDKRMADHKKNPGNVMTGTEFKALLRDTAARMRKPVKRKKAG